MEAKEIENIPLKDNTTDKPLFNVTSYGTSSYFGMWHRRDTIAIRNIRLTIAGTITGCGLAQISGVVGLCLDGVITEAELRRSLHPWKQDGVGAMICTLGLQYYRYEEKLLSLGFKQISEYNNYRHSAGYTQRLYILHL